VSEPDVPVMVMVPLQDAAVLLAVKVRRLVALVGFVPNEAVRPLGRPEACKLTLPVKPYRSFTVIQEVALAPWLTVRLGKDEDSVKLGP